MLDRVFREPARLSEGTSIGGRMQQRVILISNRVTVPTQGRATAPGGLAVAVKAALKQRSGIWFGWSGNSTDEPSPEPQIIERNRTTYAVIDLSNADYQEYYNGFANRVLWPILHYRVDLAEYSHSDLGGYQRVNRIFADHVSRILQPDDIVWVHDYHLMPLAQELRARGHENQIGFFLHIPCPPPDILLTLPRHEEILGALPCYDLVGFQTENDSENFTRYLQLQGATVGRDGATYQFKDRTTRIGVFPVGIETTVLNRLARNAGRSAFGANSRIRLLAANSSSASTASTIRRVCRSGWKASIAFSPHIRNGTGASPICRSPRPAAAKSRNMSRSTAWLTSSSDRSTGATAKRHGRRSATSTAPIRAPRCRASIAPLTSGS